ncbi:MAG: DUF58 domain-containing protein [Methanosarcinales archaeon]|nr:DUF58 domain-containing protein [Methanosarcinales archaeon]
MDTEFLKELERFALLVKKRVSTAYTGSRRSVRFGHGISPVGYREYRKGDDFKLVDWKVYGRTEKLFIKEHEEQRSLVVHILLDSSASMGYSRKFEFGAKLAIGFAYLAVQENEKFSISLFGDNLHPGEPMRGRGHLLDSIDVLDGTLPQGKTNIKRASDQFDRLISSTSLVVVISDFLDRPEDVASSIYRLSGHDLILVRVLSPEEAELDLAGDVKFVDLESGKDLITRVSQKLRDDYATKLEGHTRGIASTCNLVQADFFSFRTDVPLFDAFFEINERSKVWRA